MATKSDAQIKRGNGSLPPAKSTRELVQQSERVLDDLRSLAGSARGVARGWQELLAEELERRPYATLAVAAGVGYVLGGGLPTTLIRALIGFGGRLAIERALAQLAVPASSRRESSTAADDDDNQARA